MAVEVFGGTSLEPVITIPDLEKSVVFFISASDSQEFRITRKPNTASGKAVSLINFMISLIWGKNKKFFGLAISFKIMT